jgi:hypothetical protein
MNIKNLKIEYLKINKQITNRNHEKSNFSYRISSNH